MNSNKIGAASNMITEDYLKKTLAKSSGGKGFNPNSNPLCPKNLDSPFGNFPAKDRLKKTTTVEPLKDINSAETSIAARGFSKYLKTFKFKTRA